MKFLRHFFFLALSVSISCGGGEDPGKKEENLPTVGFDNGRSINESNTNVNVLLDIRLSAPSNQTVSVTVKTLDGTAIAGQDYAAINTTIEFTPNDMQETVTVTILGDTDFELDETFTLVLENPEGATLGTSTIEINILNDDVDRNVFIPSTGYTTPTSYSGMTLLWQDEFSGSVVDQTKWNFELGGSGWGNNELQYYRQENTFLTEGLLVIEARKENFGGRAYTSSRLTTEGKFDFQYGRVDIRAALPKGQGIWPALWMLGANFGTAGWPFCGEIDIMEMIGGGAGKDDTVHGTLHWADANGNRACTCEQNKYTLSSGIFYNEFHVFTLKWTPTSIQWLVDDQLFGTVNTTPADLSEFQNNFFFIFNVAVGGNWPGSPDGSTVFPQRMLVDYVRVFQDNS
jgi:beta-glucanase (GH16 family)